MNAPFQTEQFWVLLGNHHAPLHTLNHLVSSSVILKEIYIIKNIPLFVQHFRNSVTVEYLFPSMFVVLLIKGNCKENWKRHSHFCISFYFFGVLLMKTGTKNLVGMKHYSHLCVSVKFYKFICFRKGDPFQGPKRDSCLTLRNELSEETHVLAKQEILLGKGTRVKSRRLREPRRRLCHMARSLGFYGEGISFQVVFSQLFWLSLYWWCTPCSAKMDAREKDSGRR